MEERKCFVCRGFGHIAYHCKNIEEERSILMLLNSFEVLKNRVINRGKESEKKINKDRKMILREERLKKVVEV